MKGEPYRSRRARLCEALGDAVAILPAAVEQPRNGDVTFAFRQDSDLLYLTGFPEPDAVAVLSGKDGRLTFFVRPRDPAAEVWTGKRLGVEGAVAHYGAAEAFPLAELDGKLPELLSGHDRLFYPLGAHPDLDRRVQRVLEALRGRHNDPKPVPAGIVDPAPVVAAMRLVKDEGEIDTLRRAARLSAEGHAEAMRSVRPGMGERQLQAVVEFVFGRGGSPYVGYPTIVAGGDNATCLHYVENDATLEDGALVLIDAGAELGGYSGDVTRTFPVSGRFTEIQRAAYELVLRAQEAAIAAIAPGRRVTDAHEAATSVLVEGMVQLGLLDGEPDALVESAAHRPYYMHKTSHWLGLDVHDAGSYFDADESPRTLEPGMVLTVEPGLYVPTDDASAPAALRGIGIRIEDDVLVTDGGNEVLSVGAPKAPDEIERLMAEPPTVPV